MVHALAVPSFVGKRVRRFCAIFAACGLCCFVDAKRSEALGKVTLDSAGFFKESADRASASGTLTLAPELATEGKILEARLNLQAITFLNDATSFTVELSDGYAATSRRLMPRHQFTLGRRKYSWSRADDAWALGLWSPRFTWDPLRPERVGQTGLFYGYESANFRLLAFGSPISFPERGAPIIEDGGRLRSSSPEFIPPFDYVEVLGQRVPMSYSIKYPNLTELLNAPGGALSMRYGGERGYWGGVTYGYLPMGQADLAVDAKLSASEMVMEAEIHPRRLFHHLTTFESGFNGEGWSLWGSVSREVPQGAALPEGWKSMPIGPSVIMAGGAELDWPSGVRLAATILSVDETKPPADASQDGMNFQPRFPYESALRFSASYAGGSRIGYGMSWTFDLAERGNLLSLDLKYGAGRDWEVGFGADLFAEGSGSGMIGQYGGNDRVRGKVSYAF